MLFHLIRKLGRDCSGIGYIELSIVAPQMVLLGYYSLGL